MEIEDGTEKEMVHLEVDGSKLASVEDSPLMVGMLSAGGEERMIKKALHSPGLRPEKEEAKQEETQS